jgi:hypothetical protein
MIHSYAKYSFVAKISFFCFLFGVLSFGRAFSIIHISIYSFPIFVTEIILLISLPLIIVRWRELSKIPPLFLNIVLVYFLFGLFYSLRGFLDNNFFVFRDFTVLCCYALFLLLSFLCLNSVNLIKIFILIIVVANFIAILVGRMLISGPYSSWFYDFISQMKTFQIGIVYGISSVFLLTFYSYLKNKLYRLFILVLVAINLYMFIVFGIRSLWLAVVCLAVFLILILGFRIMVKLYFKLFISFILIGTVLFYIDFVVFKSPRLDILVGRSKGLVRALVRISDSPASYVYYDKLMPTGSEFGKTDKESLLIKPDERLALRKEAERVGYGNIIWREKIWVQTLKFASGSYFFGKGFGRYPRYDVWGYKKPCSPFVDSKLIPVHNYLITLFYKMGLFGLCLFLFFNIYVFYYALSCLKKCKTIFAGLVIKSALGVLFFWHIMALFFDVIDSPPTSILLWMLIGLVFAVVEIDKEKGIKLLDE